jgi:5-formyltetrahydrofolate cyclo-ligase
VARGIFKIARDKMNIEEAKAALRRKIRVRLDKISAAGREASSLKLCAILREQSFFQNAATILFFAPLPDEPDLWPLLQEALAAGKIVALPQFNAATQNYCVRRVENLQEEIVTGQFGVREPKSSCAEIAPDKIDLALVPGVAFDLRGNRLGRGKGFYDRLLTDVRGLKCGVAFDEQVDEVPAGRSDVPVDFILTPSGCAKSEG